MIAAPDLPDRAVRRRCADEGLVAIDYMPRGGPDPNGPFVCGYTILVPQDVCGSLARERNWTP